MKQERTPKATRMILAGLLAAGAAAFSASAVRAANPATLSIRVTCGDTQPPNAVTDLSAARVSNVEGRVVLTWTAPADQPSGPVAQYELHFATYAVAGSTTAWWTAARNYPPMGAYTPAAPGSPETFLVDGLAGGATYYFALRSRDASNNWSALDNAAVSGPQASAYPYFDRPAPVAGLLAITNPDTSFDVNWDPVTLNADGTPASDISGYVVQRSNSLTGPFNVTAASGTATSGFDFHSNAVPSSVEYLRVVAQDAAGNQSDPATSNILEVTIQGIIGQIGLAPDGTVSRAYVPATLMGEMKTKGGDLLLRMAPDANPALNRDPRTLATYDVGFISPAQVVDKNFTFSRPAMNVILAYPAPAAGSTVGVLWWNGVTWIKVGQADVDETIPTAPTISFRTALPGVYQVRIFQAATSLTMDKNSVFPRIFTPNGDGINDVVYFVIENPNHSAVDGKIYDVAGGEVADIRPAGAGAPTADTMMWDGRDRTGQVVHAGIYLYRIAGEGKKMTGTVVVAK